MLLVVLLSMPAAGAVAAGAYALGNLTIDYADPDLATVVRAAPVLRWVHPPGAPGGIKVSKSSSVLTWAVAAPACVSPLRPPSHYRRTTHKACREGPVEAGRGVTFSCDSCHSRLTISRALASFRLCSSDLEQYSGRTAPAVWLQSEQHKSKALEQARGRKSA